MNFVLFYAIIMTIKWMWVELQFMHSASIKSLRVLLFMQEDFINIAHTTHNNDDMVISISFIHRMKQPRKTFLHNNRLQQN